MRQIEKAVFEGKVFELFKFYIIYYEITVFGSQATSNRRALNEPAFL